MSKAEYVVTLLWCKDRHIIKTSAKALVLARSKKNLVLLHKLTFLEASTSLPLYHFWCEDWFQGDPVGLIFNFLLQGAGQLCVYI